MSTISACLPLKKAWVGEGSKSPLVSVTTTSIGEWILRLLTSYILLMFVNMILNVLLHVSESCYFLKSAIEAYCIKRSRNTMYYYYHYLFEKQCLSM